MKLTVTNSSIGLIVLIVHVHQKHKRDQNHLRYQIKRGSFLYQLLIYSCASLTWWLLRGGCTRSHSEHGRETPLRQWYFVLRRGRVGRCQVCKTQLIKSHHNRHIVATKAALAALFVSTHEKLALNATNS